MGGQRRRRPEGDTFGGATTNTTPSERGKRRRPRRNRFCSSTVGSALLALGPAALARARGHRFFPRDCGLNVLSRPRPRLLGPRPVLVHPAPAELGETAVAGGSSSSPSPPPSSSSSSSSREADDAPDVKFVCLMLLRYPWSPLMHHEVAHLLDAFLGLGHSLPLLMVRVSRAVHGLVRPYLNKEYAAEYKDVDAAIAKRRRWL